MNQKIIPSVSIRGIEIYCPEYVEDVDGMVQMYKKSGIDIEIDVKDFLGKKYVHKVDGEQENTLTMATKAAQKVLHATGLEGKDIDMIVLASTLPEYLVPPTSRIIHTKIGGKPEAICYDINANCCGMLFSLNQIACHMQADKDLNKVLLIGCDSSSIHFRKDQYISRTIVGDSACAVLLEKSQGDVGIIDKKFLSVYTHDKSLASFPSCGSSHIYEASIEERKCILGNAEVESSRVVKDIQEMLIRNHLTVDDIAMFCFSQFSEYFLKSLRKELSISQDKSLYIGNQYGYTGVTCSFISLYHAIQEKKIKRGDYVFFWVFSAGVQMVYTLLKY